MIEMQIRGKLIAILVLGMGGTCCDARTAHLPPVEQVTGGRVVLVGEIEILRNTLHEGPGSIEVSQIKNTCRSDKNRLILAASKLDNSGEFMKYYFMYKFYTDNPIQLRQNDPKLAEKEEELSRKDFQTFAKEFLPTQAEKVTQFIQDFKVSSQPETFILESYFKKKFCFDSLNLIPIKSNDPKDMAYLRYPIFHLFNAIRNSYRRSKDNLRTVYILIKLSSADQKILKKMAESGGDIAFPIFIKGFTSQKQANAQLIAARASDPNICMLSVSFPDRQKTDPRYDFGYYVFKTNDPQILKDGDVVFNVMNFFSVQEIFSASEYDIVYGSLAKAEKQSTDRIKSGKEPEILKISTICNAISKYYLRSQSNLFRLLSNRDDALSTSRFISQNSLSKKIMTMELLSEIEVEMDNGDYGAALDIINKINQPDKIVQAKKVQCLYEAKKYAELDALLPSLEGPPPKSSLPIDWESYQLIQVISAKRKMQKDDFQKASEQLKALIKEMGKYDQETCEFMCRDAIKTEEECFKRLNKSATTETSSPFNWSPYLSGIKLRNIS